MTREKQKKSPDATSVVTQHGGEGMKRRVYDYIAENPGTTGHRCAKALDIEELAVLTLINALHKDGVVSLAVLPLGNDIDPVTSSYYSVCREYVEGTDI